MKTRISLLILAFVFCHISFLVPAEAASKGEIDRETKTALATLYEKSPVAKELAKTAKGILVFPRVVKAGFIFGGQSGDGSLIVNGKPVAYYNTSAFSYGLQAGVQSFGYALFFMTEEDINGMRFGSQVIFSPICNVLLKACLKW